MYDRGNAHTCGNLLLITLWLQRVRLAQGAHMRHLVPQRVDENDLFGSVLYQIDAARKRKH